VETLRSRSLSDRLAASPAPETSREPTYSYLQPFMEVILNDQNFEAEVLKSDVPVLVDFWAPWCGPCKILGPIVEELAKDMEGKPVKIAKMNVDESQDIPPKYGIMSIPTLMIFKGGEVVDQMVGVTAKDTLVEKLTAQM
jgi:thioredoxin 1